MRIRLLALLFVFCLLAVPANACDPPLVTSAAVVQTSFVTPTFISTPIFATQATFAPAFGFNAFAASPVFATPVSAFGVAGVNVNVFNGRRAFIGGGRRGGFERERIRINRVSRF